MPYAASLHLWPSMQYAAWLHVWPSIWLIHKWHDSSKHEMTLLVTIHWLHSWPPIIPCMDESCHTWISHVIYACHVLSCICDVLSCICDVLSCICDVLSCICDVLSCICHVLSCICYVLSCICEWVMSHMHVRYWAAYGREREGERERERRKEGGREGERGSEGERGKEREEERERKGERRWEEREKERARERHNERGRERDRERAGEREREGEEKKKEKAKRATHFRLHLHHIRKKRRREWGEGNRFWWTLGCRWRSGNFRASNRNERCFSGACERRLWGPGALCSAPPSPRRGVESVARRARRLPHTPSPAHTSVGFQ